MSYADGAWVKRQLLVLEGNRSFSRLALQLGRSSKGKVIDKQAERADKVGGDCLVVRMRGC